MDSKILKELNEAEKKAWDALSRYKFWMFGYWAAWWVKLNRLGEFNKPNPFTGLVKAAKSKRDNQTDVFKDA